MTQLADILQGPIGWAGPALFAWLFLLWAMVDFPWPKGLWAWMGRELFPPGWAVPRVPQSRAGDPIIRAIAEGRWDSGMFEPPTLAPNGQREQDPPQVSQQKPLEQLGSGLISMNEFRRLRGQPPMSEDEYGSVEWVKLKPGPNDWVVFPKGDTAVMPRTPETLVQVPNAMITSMEVNHDVGGLMSVSGTWQSSGPIEFKEK